jgi:hypothetical protein
MMEEAMSRTLISTVSAAVLVLLAGAPAQAQDVNVDFDKTAKFNSFSTYQLTPGTLPDGVSPLMVQRAAAAIDAEVTAIGLTKVDKDPDLIVVFHGATREDKQLTTWGTGGGYYGRAGWGSTTTQTTVSTIVRGGLMIDIIDARAKKLIFRGTATDTMSDNPQKNEKKINKAVEKIFNKYPGNENNK